MAPLQLRTQQAQECWKQGLAAENAGELQRAYQLFTEAHDLIMDCAKHHQKAHVELRRINWKLGHYTELAGDWLLHVFAPLGVFELVSYFSKTEAFASRICKRNP